MITLSAPTLQTNSINIHQDSPQTWQETLSSAVTDPRELLKILGLSTDLLPGAQAGSQQFQMRVPHTYIARMEPGNVHDPLLQQVLPLQKELELTAGYIQDPLGEGPKNSQRGILHKYNGRLLLLPTQLCAVNCRFCFRRHFPYEDNTLNRDEWQSALNYIREDTSLKEVILSGGDPLSLNDKRLSWIIEQLATIPHLQRVRFHTRLPVVIPQRVTEEMIRWMTSTRLKPVMVIHCNHPNEVNRDMAEAMERMHRAGIRLLNQSTLLRGVNDSPATLITLSEKLFDCHVMPYYLHLLDKVQGAAHFDIEEAKARELVGEMASQCSGYLVPKLTRETAGQPAKTIVPLIYK